MTNPQDSEIIAMRACWKAMRPFDLAARKRMIQWLYVKAQSEPVVEQEAKE